MIEPVIGAVSAWVAAVANLLPLGYAFAAGMVATVNPCGFAMLPAYLGLYLGSRDTTASRAAVLTGGGTVSLGGALFTQLARAVLVTAMVTAGFILLFGSVGLVISIGGQLIVRLVPWIALGIGVILVVLGIAMLRGHHVSATFAVRLAERLGHPGTISPRGFFIFGIAYGTASLSCTIPIFLTVVGSTLAVGGFAAAASQFISYALGMGLVILVLTVGIALFKGAVVGGLRRVLPYVERVSALLLILAGTYIVYYWLFTGGLIRILT